MPKKLVLFVDPAWKRDLPHIPLLYPFWGNALSKDKTPFQWKLFEQHSFDVAYYAITQNIAEADIVLMPYSHNTVLLYAPDILELAAEASRESGKPLLIDGIGDIERPVTTPNSYVIRYGGYKFEKKENEIHIPPYADDLLEMYYANELQTRHKSAKPSISFAGWATLTPTQEFRATLKELPDRLRAVFDSRWGAKKKGVFFRRDAVAILKHSSLVESRFLIRTSYSGNTNTAEKNPDELRREFVENIVDSDYMLDVRGDANASTRLFEALSLGRVPVIVDTERNLPFSDKLDYKNFSVFVDFRELSKLPKIVADFNNKISEEQFIEMQKAARDAYLNYFRVDALTKHLIREIQNKLHSQ